MKEREEKGPYKTTTQLAHVIRKAMPRPESFKKDPATRTFQALRIFVNNEVSLLLLSLLLKSLSLLSPLLSLIIVH